MPALRYVLVDVFTDRPLAGNPLAVFTDARGLTQDTMQSLARELNLSETTFVLPAETGGTARVRIFTPKAEIPFAGHPTLGTAFVLGRLLEERTLTLELGVGHVPVVLEREAGLAVRGWFSRPAPRPVAFVHTDALLSALGVQQTASPLVVYDNGMRHAAVHLTSHAEVAGLRPDLNAVSRVLIDTVDVFASDEKGVLLRVFAPSHGVYEDPATGSAAAPVFLHLVEHAGFDPRATLLIRQGEHIHRPSLLEVRQATGPAGALPRIEVGGSGVIVASGEFNLRASGRDYWD